MKWRLALIAIFNWIATLFTMSLTPATPVSVLIVLLNAVAATFLLLAALGARR